ncbi:MAG: hypothetical protein U0166_05870 [Acidobacteriota bacterium]
MITEWFYGKLLPGAYADEHISHYTRQGLYEALKESGFEPLEHAYVAASELIIRARRTPAPVPESVPALALAKSIAPAVAAPAPR